MSKNKIRELRLKKGLTQKQLAETVGTTQQHIHRIETGNQVTRFNLALAICKVLDQPIEKVFVEAAKILKKTPSNEIVKEAIFNDNCELASEMDRAGIDLDPMYWAISFRLRGMQDDLIREISSRDKDRLTYCLINSDKEDCLSYFVFYTETSVLCINFSHLIFCHSLFNTFYAPQEEEPYGEYSGPVKIYLASETAPREFSVGNDPDYKESDLDDPGQFRNIIYDLEGGFEKNTVIHFLDLDDERVFLRAEDVTMIEIPLWVIRPELLDEEQNEEDL